MKAFQVLLLAGGIGKRMWPLETCKSLINFLGKPIIKYIFEDLVKAGIENFKVVCAEKYLPQIKATFSSEQKIEFFVQRNPLGMADGVLSVKNLDLQPLVVVSPEDLLDGKLYKDFFLRCKQTESEIVLTGICQKDYFPGGYFVLDGKRIKGIVEKPQKGKQPSNFVNLVLHYFKKPQLFVDYLHRVSSSKDDVYELVLDKMIKDGIQTELFEYRGSWTTLKHPWHILKMMETIFKYRMEKKIAKDVKISPKATIKGKVIIEQGARILEGACVIGPVFIGKNTIIGNNTLVRESMIGENCVVGFNTEVARSWIGNDCWFHKNYIGDSVLEENISFGSGAVTANLRLDEKEVLVKKGKEQLITGRKKFGVVIGKGVRIGVNASLMPGVLVGANSFVGAGVILNQNLEEKSFAHWQSKLVVKKNLKKISGRSSYPHFQSDAVAKS